MLPNATVKAQSKTIIVPDDYPTIAAAIGNATNGDTVLVRSGTYLEHSLVINKTISLIGQNADNTIIEDIDPNVPINIPGMNPPFTMMSLPTPVTISANNVVISGFTITNINRNSTVGIYSSGSKTLITGNNCPDGIELEIGSYQTAAQNNASTINCVSPNSFIANNTLEGEVAGNGGINVGASGLSVADNSVAYGNVILNEEFGIDVYNCQGVFVVENSAVNSHGAIAMNNCGNNVIEGNTVTNSFIGLSEAISAYAQVNAGNGGNNTFYANNIVNNSNAVILTGIDDTLYSNNFINNSQDTGSFGPQPNAPLNPTPVILWDNGTIGNYWSDYLTKYPNATEVDSSGVGNIPYAIDANDTDPYPLIAPYDTSTLPIQLPSWVNLSLAAPLPTPYFPPPHSSSPSASPSPRFFYLSFAYCIAFSFPLVSSAAFFNRNCCWCFSGSSGSCGRCHFFGLLREAQTRQLT